MIKEHFGLQEYCGVRVSRTLKLAIPAENIEEILQLRIQEIAPIPGIEPWMIGAINHKGNLLWVLHLEGYLGLRHSPWGGSILAAVVSSTNQNTFRKNTVQNQETKRIACGILGIEGLLSFSESNLIPIPAQLPTIARTLLKGIAKQEDLTCAVLDLQALFSSLNSADIS